MASSKGDPSEFPLFRIKRQTNLFVAQRPWGGGDSSSEHGVFFRDAFFWGEGRIARAAFGINTRPFPFLAILPRIPVMRMRTIPAG